MSAVDARTHYMPFHRNDKYPKHLYSNFRNMKPTMLKKYIDSYELPVRPDVNPNEMCIAVARHFDSHLEVDEDEVLARFMNSIRRVPAPQHGTEPSAVGKRTTTRRNVEDETGGGDDMNDETPVPTSTAPSRKQQRGNTGNTAASRGNIADDDHGGNMNTMGRNTNRNDQRNIPMGGGHPNMYHLQNDGSSIPPHIIPPTLPSQMPMNQQQTSSNRNTASTTGTARGGNTNKRNNQQNNNNTNNNANNGNEPETFCLCKQEAYGEMIACDNENCPIEWFHLGCVGLSNTNRPSGEWFCPECKRHQRGGNQANAQQPPLLSGQGNAALRPNGNQMLPHPHHMMNMGGNMHPMSDDDYNHLRNPNMMGGPPRGMPGMNGPRGPLPPGYLMNNGGGMPNAGMKRGVNGQPMGHPLPPGNNNNMMRKPGGPNQNNNNGPNNNMQPMRGNAVAPHPMNMMGQMPRRPMPVGPPGGMMMNNGPPPPHNMMNYPPPGMNMNGPPRGNMGPNNNAQQPYMNGPPRGAAFKNTR